MLKAGLAHSAPENSPPGRLLSGRRGVSSAGTPCWWRLARQLLVSRLGTTQEVPASAAEQGGSARGDGSPACRGLAWGTPERGGPGQGSQERQVRGGPEKCKRQRKRVRTWEKKSKKGWQEGFRQDQRISWDELARP